MRIREKDPLENREWVPGYWSYWSRGYIEGGWFVRYHRYNHDDWYSDSRTRWRHGRVSKPRTGRSMAKQQLRATDPNDLFNGRWVV